MCRSGRTGSADMPDRTWQPAFTNRFRRDDLLAHCLAVATVGGAAVLDPSATRLRSVADRPGLDVGDVAELHIVEGESVASAVMDRSHDGTVTHGGEVVANGLALL